MISIKGLEKSYDGLQVLRGVDLEVSAGETVVLIGRSGCGKSTLLRCINALERFDQGTITVAGHRLARPLGAGMTESRFQGLAWKLRSEVGMVFQSFNLFPHLTVLENLMLAPRVVRGMTEEEARSKAEVLLAKVGLVSHAQHLPRQLSGGQSQRAAIARSLAMSPQVMLYDEPTSALDPGLVDEVLAVMKKLGEEGMTQVIVTHEMRFARDVADRLVHVDGGKVIEQGSPEMMFSKPQDDRTQRFLSRFI